MALLRFLLYFFAIILTAVKSIFIFFVPYRYKEKDVSQDIVLITGGGSGIGRILAQLFASKGSKVVIMDIDEQGMEKTCQLVRRVGGTCTAYKCDISDREHVYATAEKIKDEVGSVSILVNNAGIPGSGKRILDLDDDRTVQTMHVNAMSCFWTANAFLPDMMNENRGHIVFISSFGGLAGGPSVADYCASKFAMLGFAESLLLELVSDGYDNIKVTSVCPWIIDTGMFQGARNPYIPELEPRATANRIFQGILANENLICIPRSTYILSFLKTVLPVESGLKLFQMLEFYTVMDGFTGRGKQIQDPEPDYDEEVGASGDMNNLRRLRRSISRTSSKQSININGGDGTKTVDMRSD